MATTGFKMLPQSRRVIKKLIGLDNLAKQGIRQGMSDSGHALIKIVSKEILRKPTSGRTYIVRSRTGRRRRRVHRRPSRRQKVSSGLGK